MTFVAKKKPAGTVKQYTSIAKQLKGLADASISADEINLKELCKKGSTRQDVFNMLKGQPLANLELAVEKFEQLHHEKDKKTKHSRVKQFLIDPSAPDRARQRKEDKAAAKALAKSSKKGNFLTNFLSGEDAKSRRKFNIQKNEMKKKLFPNTEVQPSSIDPSQSPTTSLKSFSSSNSQEPEHPVRRAESSSSLVEDQTDLHTLGPQIPVTHTAAQQEPHSLASNDFDDIPTDEMMLDTFDEDSGDDDEYYLGLGSHVHQPQFESDSDESIISSQSSSIQQAPYLQASQDSIDSPDSNGTTNSVETTIPASRRANNPPPPITSEEPTSRPNNAVAPAQAATRTMAPEIAKAEFESRLDHFIKTYDIETKSSDKLLEYADIAKYLIPVTNNDIDITDTPLEKLRKRGESREALFNFLMEESNENIQLAQTRFTDMHETKKTQKKSTSSLSRIFGDPQAVEAYKAAKQSKAQSKNKSKKANKVKAATDTAHNASESTRTEPQVKTPAATTHNASEPTSTEPQVKIPADTTHKASEPTSTEPQVKTPADAPKKTKRRGFSLFKSKSPKQHRAAKTQKQQLSQQPQPVKGTKHTITKASATNTQPIQDINALLNSTRLLLTAKHITPPSTHQVTPPQVEPHKTPAAHMQDLLNLSSTPTTSNNTGEARAIPVDNLVEFD